MLEGHQSLTGLDGSQAGEFVVHRAHLIQPVVLWRRDGQQGLLLALPRYVMNGGNLRELRVDQDNININS